MLRPLYYKLINNYVKIFYYIFLTSYIIYFYHDLHNLVQGVEQDEFEVVLGSTFSEKGLIPQEKGISHFVASIINHRFIVRYLAGNALDVFNSGLHSSRILLSILKVISIAFFYVFIRNSFSEKTAFLLTVLYGVSSYRITSSTIILPGNFCEPFGLVALSLVSYLKHANFWFVFFRIFSSGIFVSLALLSYNVAYMFFVSLSIFLLYKIYKLNSFTLKSKLLLYIGFLIVPALSMKHVILDIIYEYENRNYILVNSVVKQISNKGFFDIILLNFKRVFQQFYIVEGHVLNSGDMFFYCPYPLVEYFSLSLALGGLIICLFKPEVRIFATFFLLDFISYQIILGSIFPRTWHFSILGIAILSAVSLNEFFNFIDSFHRPYSRYVTLILFFLVIYTSVSQWEIAKKNANDSLFFQNSFMEMLQISNNHISNKDTYAVVLQDKNTPYSMYNWMYSAMTFADISEGSSMDSISRKKPGDYNLIEQHDKSEIVTRLKSGVTLYVIKSIWSEKLLGEDIKISIDLDEWKYFVKIHIAQ